MDESHEANTDKQGPLRMPIIDVDRYQKMHRKHDPDVKLFFTIVGQLYVVSTVKAR